MDLSDEIARVLIPPLQRVQSSKILRFTLGFFWCLLHLPVSIVHLGSYLIKQLLYYMISSGLLQKYQNLQLDKLRYLAIVVESEEAKNTTKIKQLLSWLSSIGVKYVTLYDMEGVLKKSVETDLKSSENPSVADGNAVASVHQERMTVELLSFSDGKGAVAKAASFLCLQYLEGDSVGYNKMEPVFTETDVTNALKAVGHGGPDPDLLLVYGPARCHLGFPAWRIRYTEIVHMGSLRSMKYGAVVKAIYDFSKKHQNYENMPQFVYEHF
ncbi:dehydrodolichyl diphosphate synthase complex subunit NUS1 isoform X1 [Phoenix dactylifera]|uniref:ditrans,polycis-polyprenyl diphosphate synthase [(2E,6E)-farnesyldiphosphate specific] n=1 Tax=Phoenix dactylifera TaxID=42345 RepID=A0A8B9AJ87_PHODC|nr:dehydrodolichyl diphosphate synthase complex subunit NUS1 isoform X1 [Phoenix dactylifera]